MAQKKTAQQQLLDVVEAYVKWNYMCTSTETCEKRRDAVVKQLRKRNRMRPNQKW